MVHSVFHPPLNTATSMTTSSRLHTLASNPNSDLAKFNTAEQGTKEWWAQRRDKMSGSKIANICFLKNNEERKVYWEEVFGIRPRKPLDAEAMVRVKYGTDHEIDGVKNMLHRLHDVNMWEIGYEKHHKHGAWFGSSPDGVVHWPQKYPNEPWGALEVKCSTKKKNNVTIPHQGVPYYYIGQMHAEMKCMPLPHPCRYTVFVSWSESKCKMYIVRFNETFWNMMWDLIVDFALNDTTWEAFKEKRDAFVAASKAEAKKAQALHPRGGFDTMK